MKTFKAKLLENPVEISRDHYLIRIDSRGMQSQPGQFVNIKTGKHTDPLLRRPFSIHNHEKSIIEIIFKVAGKGTELLRGTVCPSEIDIIAPLGCGFSAIDNGRALLIGGGVGNAPLYYLAKHLREKGNYIQYIYGTRTEELIYLRKKYEEISDDFILCTDDGTCGRKGFVTEAAMEIIQDHTVDNIYICGPSIMMSRMTGCLRSNPAHIEVSIENYFGCGIGVCSGCTIRTTDGQRRACIDGPVFDGKKILWESV